ncbi:MAG: InlB B-repeat-containing protein, partial [Clostridiales bacterium]|nr:InlB B-repeat-containing protein [Clostridiales bacterium]
DILNVVSGPILCTVFIKYTGDTPADISFERKGVYPPPDLVGIYIMRVDSFGETTNTPLVGPNKITVLPYSSDKHTVNFHSNGGSYVSSQIVTDGEQALKPADPTRAGFTFDAWYANTTLTGTPYDFTTPVTADLHLYAKWSPSGSVTTYTVTFYPNKGTPPPAVQTVIEGEKATAPSPISKTDCILFGWYDNSAFTGMRYDFNTPVTANLNLYAMWIPITYDVVFHPNGGIPAPSVKIVPIGEKVASPEVMTKSGFKFGGWYKNAGLSGAPYSFDTIVSANLHLYARWIPDSDTTYTVTFHSNGGTPAPYEQIVVKDEKAIKPDEMTNTGFTFDGWYTDADFTDEYDFDTQVNSKLDLYAKWDPVSTITYTVTFHPDGGTPEPAPTIVFEGTLVAPPPTMTKSGFSFGGWYDNAALSGSTYNFGTPVAADLDLYAKWIPVYTVTFHPDGGTPAPAAQPVIEGEKATAPPAMTKTGFTFGGWYDNAAFSGSVYDFNTSVTANLDLYAKWIPVYTVTFHPDGGNPAPTGQTVIEGEKAIKPDPNPTKAGFKFGGWYDNDDLDGAPYSFATPVTADLDLYARWIPDSAVTFTVTFHPNGGTPEPAEQIVIEGEEAIEPPPMIKAGFRFDGWYADEDFADEYDFEAPVSDDLDLYAKWTKTYTVLFDCDGGDPAPVAQIVGEGEKATEPAAMTRDGYAFDGWYAEGTLKTVYNFNTPVTGNIVIYAKWIGDLDDTDTFIVTFLDWDKELYIKEVNDGDPVIEPNPDPTKTGFAFDGWYSNKGLTDKYDFATPVIADLDLYVKWIPLSLTTYTVTFHPDGGIPAPVNTIAFEGTLVTPPAAMIKAGFTFGGWYDNSALTGSTYNFNTPVTADLDLYAKWNSSIVGPGGGGTTYIITFNSNGGSDVGQKTVVSGSKVAKPADPTKEGYSFVAWYTNVDLTAEYNFDSPVFNNFTLYAKWEVSEISDKRPPVSAKVKSLLETETHIRYIYGYPNAPVRPNGSITRAEVAMIFYRLLLDPDKDDEVDNIFRDVPEGVWYSQAVKYLAEIGIINGYEDGTFKPNQPITRAEFAKIAASFDDISSGADNPFSDLSDSHWAYSYIISCFMKGWINGYPSGDFKPDNNITRAEAIKIVNFMLGRGIRLEDIPAGVIGYTDLTRSHWAYNEIIEASMKHEYERDEDNWEIWTDYNN